MDHFPQETTGNTNTMDSSHEYDILPAQAVVLEDSNQEPTTNTNSSISQNKITPLSAENLATTHPQYVEMRNKARDENFEDLEALDILRPSGYDMDGRPLLVIIGAHLDTREVDLQKLLRYFIHLMDEIVNTPYSVVYIHTNVNWNNRPSVWWLIQSYRLLPPNYKKNIGHLAIVHPSVWIRTTIWMFRPLISEKFWNKLVFADRFEELWLDKVVEKGAIDIPRICVEYEKIEEMKLEEARQHYGNNIYLPKQ